MSFWHWHPKIVGVIKITYVLKISLPPIEIEKTSSLVNPKKTKKDGHTQTMVRNLGF